MYAYHRMMGRGAGTKKMALSILHSTIPMATFTCPSACPSLRSAAGTYTFPLPSSVSDLTRHEEKIWPYHTRCMVKYKHQTCKWWTMPWEQFTKTKREKKRLIAWFARELKQKRRRETNSLRTQKTGRWKNAHLKYRVAPNSGESYLGGRLSLTYHLFAIGCCSRFFPVTFMPPLELRRLDHTIKFVSLSPNQQFFSAASNVGSF